MVAKHVSITLACGQHASGAPNKPKCLIRLHSKSVNHYRSDVLAKLIAEIVNPGMYKSSTATSTNIMYNCFLGHKRNFFSNPNNKPDWYPDDVAFRSANHKTKGG